jgi:cytochrome c oxidase cbb3-type subunit IV
MSDFVSYFVGTVWTPIFLAIFVGVLVYAMWPANRKKFDDAARTPLRED